MRLSSPSAGEPPSLLSTHRAVGARERGLEASQAWSRRLRGGSPSQEATGSLELVLRSQEISLARPFHRSPAPRALPLPLPLPRPRPRPRPPFFTPSQRSPFFLHLYPNPFRQRHCRALPFALELQRALTSTSSHSLSCSYFFSSIARQVHLHLHLNQRAPAISRVSCLLHFCTSKSLTS